MEPGRSWHPKRVCPCCYYCCTLSVTAHSLPNIAAPRSQQNSRLLEEASRPSLRPLGVSRPGGAHDPDLNQSQHRVAPPTETGSGRAAEGSRSDRREPRGLGAAQFAFSSGLISVNSGGWAGADFLQPPSP